MKKINDLIELKKMLDDGLIDQTEFKQLKKAMLEEKTTAGHADTEQSDVKKPITPPPSNLTSNADKARLRRNLFFILGIFVVIIGSILTISMFRNATVNDTSLSAGGQTELNNQYSQPPNGGAIAATPPEAYEVPAEVRYDQFYGNGIRYQFFPIGWSANGKFAYIQIPANEGSDYDHIEVIIKDLITDKIVDSYSSKDYPSQENLLTTVWPYFHSGLLPLLKKHQIIPGNGTDLKPLPFRFNDISYDFHLYNKYDMNEIAAASIHLKKNNELDKKIYAERYEEYKPMSSKIAGYLQSPFENRVAVFFIQEHRGFEGPPNVISFDLIGCQID
jgi:hypothetical protein